MSARFIGSSFLLLWDVAGAVDKVGDMKIWGRHEKSLCNFGVVQETFESSLEFHGSKQ